MQVKHFVENAAARGQKSAGATCGCGNRKKIFLKWKVWLLAGRGVLCYNESNATEKEQMTWSLERV